MQYTGVAREYITGPIIVLMTLTYIYIYREREREREREVDGERCEKFIEELKK